MYNIVQKFHFFYFLKNIMNRFTLFQASVHLREVVEILLMFAVERLYNFHNFTNFCLILLISCVTLLKYSYNIRVGGIQNEAKDRS